jgi:hypothetical protein
VRCPDGTVCEHQGITLDTLPIAPGYWRSGALSTTIRPCELADACKGTNITEWEAMIWEPAMHRRIGDHESRSNFSAAMLAQAYDVCAFGYARAHVSAVLDVGVIPWLQGLCRSRLDVEF